MTPDPAQRFLGVPASSDAMTLLGLSADRCTPAHIDAALRDRLARLFMHPDGRSAEAEDVRRLLRDAADRLRQARVVAAASAATPPATRAAPLQRPIAPSLNLTDFDRQVLAVLIACGGWNHESRSRLVAISAAHNVSVQGLIRVIQGLGDHARSGGGRLGMHDICAGVRMTPVTPTAAPGVPEGGQVLEKLAGALADEIRRDDPSTIIRLSVLFGLITLMAGIFGLRLLLASDGPKPPELTPAGTASTLPSTIDIPT